MLTNGSNGFSILRGHAQWAELFPLDGIWDEPLLGYSSQNSVLWPLALTKISSTCREVGAETPFRLICLCGIVLPNAAAVPLAFRAVERPILLLKAQSVISSVKRDASDIFYLTMPLNSESSVEERQPNDDASRPARYRFQCFRGRREGLIPYAESDEDRSAVAGLRFFV